MNLRPSGYEPDELPGCSTARQVTGNIVGSPNQSRVFADFSARRTSGVTFCWMEGGALSAGRGRLAAARRRAAARGDENQGARVGGSD